MILNRKISNSRNIKWFNKLGYENNLNLPRLIIPKLSDTKGRYLASVKPLVDVEAFKKHEKLANDFFENEGLQLDKTLREEDKANGKSLKYPFSYIEKDWDSMYLGGRYSSAINVNPGYGLNESSFNHDSMVRVCAFITSTLKCLQKLKLDAFEPDGKLCMASFAKQFGTSRIPQVNCDVLRCSPNSNHIAVLCNEQIFELQVLFGENGILDMKNMQESLNRIKDRSLQNKPFSLSALTGEDRDVWAMQRDELFHEDVINQVSLDSIDTALFVLVLDERSGNSLSQQSEMTLHGLGSNRWYDKLQVIAYEDGHVGLNFEHSFSDGTAWNRWLHEVWHDMHDTNSGFSRLPEMDKIVENNPFRLLEWNVPNSVTDSIEKAKENLQEMAKNTDSYTTDITSMTKDLCKQWKLSPDGIAQMGYQLGYANLHGNITATYESCATRAFLHGRTETIRSATSDALNFVNSVQNNDSKDMQKNLLHKAVHRHVDMAKTAAQGQGVDRHLFALSSIAGKSGKPVHPFLSDPIKSMSSHFKLSSSNVTMPFLKYFTFGAVVQDGYGLGYLVQKDKLALSVTSYKSCKQTDSLKLSSSIDKAFQHIQQIQN